MLSIAICDDEEYFRITEKQLILKYMAGKNCECMIDMYESGKELLALKSAISQYHIIFLDVNMEEIDGIETAKEIRKITKDVFIVFVTAFITYALEGYKVDAVRYLIKDHESLEKAMTECMDTILEKMDYEENEMTFDFQEGKTTISLENLIYVESNLHRLVFYMVGEDAVHYTIYMKLDDRRKPHVFVNQDACQGCKNCLHACIYGVYRWNKEKNISEAAYPEDCTACRHCEF